MALIRASYSETEEYWTARISEYLEGAHHPQQALETRVPYVALQDDSVVGFIAGHRAIRLRR